LPIPTIAHWDLIALPMDSPHYLEELFVVASEIPDSLHFLEQLHCPRQLPTLCRVIEKEGLNFHGKYNNGIKAKKRQIMTTYQTPCPKYTFGRYS